jgi:hypothetical protein
MAKQIVFTYEDKEYTLEFTRRTVKQMEDEGFVAQDIDRKPMTLLPALFAGAFKAHHRFVKQDVIDKIYAGMPHKDELIGKLAEMYNDPIVTLMEEPDEKAVKNPAACPLFIVTGKLLKNSAVIT